MNEQHQRQLRLADQRRIAKLERRAESALLHYSIGEQAAEQFTSNRGVLMLNANADLVVSWRFVAERMAAALRGEEEETK